MLNKSMTRIYPQDIIEYDLLSTENGLVEEGDLLGLTNVNGKQFAKRMDGTITQFIGVAYGVRLTTKQIVRMESFTITATGLTFTSQVNADADPIVYQPVANSAPVAFTKNVSSPFVAAAGEYQENTLTPLTLTFDSADAGKTVTILFEHTLTQAEVLARGTDWSPTLAGGVNPSDFLGKIPVVVKSPQIVTNRFSAVVGWFGAYTAGAAATGVLVPTGGTDISGDAAAAGPGYVRILEAPTNYGYGTDAWVRMSVNM